MESRIPDCQAPGPCSRGRTVEKVIEAPVDQARRGPCYAVPGPRASRPGRGPSARTGGEQTEEDSWRAETQIPRAAGRMCRAGTRGGLARPTVCAPLPPPRVRRADRSRRPGHLAVRLGPGERRLSPRRVTREQFEPQCALCAAGAAVPNPARLPARDAGRQMDVWTAPRTRHGRRPRRRSARESAGQQAVCSV